MPLITGSSVPRPIRTKPHRLRAKGEEIVRSGRKPPATANPLVPGSSPGRPTTWQSKEVRVAAHTNWANVEHVLRSAALIARAAVGRQLNAIRQPPVYRRWSWPSLEAALNGEADWPIAAADSTDQQNTLPITFGGRFVAGCLLSAFIPLSISAFSNNFSQRQVHSDPLRREHERCVTPRQMRRTIRGRIG